ncbi:replication protein A 70 kDa DNA-binding subunit B-like [Humulus lupulus]|uniref:replication protein A 70 kDa DNA-binding subunit B-like n=1 Tax=Humulus lupulus TaxID=3486 RepID=UPI002B415ED5|nr:replication protein A 70 kDa DNA-binding subunit B-like [Humulus lupulus]
MERQVKSIKEIFPRSKNWIYKVLAAEKHPPRNSRHNSSIFQHLLLVDKEGKRIQATIFEENIQKYEKLIIMFKTYNISNALVNFIPQQYRIVDNKYQWIINEHTTVKEVEDEEIINTPQELYNFSFVPFNALEQYKTRTMEVDILALVIDIQPRKYIPTSSGVSCVRELTLLNEEKSQILLTVWDELFENECAIIASKIGARPVLATKNLKVVSYMNTSLSTKPASRLLIDLELPQAIGLRTWRDENNMYLEHFVSRDLLASSTLTIPTSDALTPIITVKNLVEQKDRFWIEGKFCVRNLNQNFWYMACDKCHKSTQKEFNEPVEKDHCNNKDGKAIPRCFVLVECEDTSGVLPAAIFGENAEKFIHCSALELMKHTTEVSNIMMQ